MEDETGNPTRYPPQLLKMNAGHRRKFSQMVADAKTAYTFAKTPLFTKMIRESAGPSAPCAARISWWARLTCAPAPRQKTCPYGDPLGS